MISENQIEDFFNQYASNMNTALFEDINMIDALMPSFADFVVGANPVGIMGGKNDAEFKKAIAQGIEFYKKIGITSMNIQAKDITILDDFHAMTKVHWISVYNNGSVSGEIPFDVIYVVQIKNGSVRIFAYVTGDEQSALKTHRLID